jgi:hypothetical protein
MCELASQPRDAGDQLFYSIYSAACERGAPALTDGRLLLRDAYNLSDRFLCLPLPSRVGFGVGRSPSVEGRTRG